VFKYCHSTHGELRDDQSYNIREFLSSGKGPQSREVADLLDRCIPFWTWNEAELGADDRILPRQSALGLYSAQDPEWGRLVPELARRPVLVSTGNPYIIIASQVVYGLPLFPLNRVKQYAYYYNQLVGNDRTPLHLLADWRNWPDLLPSGAYGPELLFALGVRYGLIEQRSDGFSWQAPGGKRQKLGADRDAALKAFVKSAAAQNVVRDYFDLQRRQQGDATVQHDLLEYVRSNEAWLSDAAPDDLFRAELLQIADFLRNEYDAEFTLAGLTPGETSQE
jgi:hypothetical protein